MDDQPSLFQPLIHGKPTIPPSTNNHCVHHASHNSGTIDILVRFLSVFFIGLLALYADREASKGFDITIINDIKHSVAGRRFHLFYVSNDKATRIILDTSNFVECLLYPEAHAQPKKHINHVILRLSSLNLTSHNTGVVVHHSPNKKNDHFVFDISPSIMDDQPNAHRALVTAILRGMAHVWLWDGEAHAPPELIDGMVEYTRMVGEQGLFDETKSYGMGTKLPGCDKFWWKDKDPRVVAQMLNYYEGHSKGFIQRLNGAMREKWHDRMVDDALGMPLQNLCGTYNFCRYSS
ncbi:PREDICTED: uncharacterized protein LOC103328833 [Prunus mume]|uniref:Uncharacterized protein LOC103328833 n=1 Tax=Prunus mume TaxID=102107 RepID=A0ABM0NT61_PRUMU|nr:PREDICTED: uncharacterized protein LOC103328833 [Prunus mume]